MHRRLALLLVMFCSLLVFGTPGRAAAATPKGLPSGLQEAKITGYNDGDKFEVSVDGETHEVNLLGADAPELNTGDLGECFAKDAKDYVAKLLKKNQIIYLEKDKDDKDGKDRLLRYVWTANSAKKAYMVNEFLISRGYASFKSRDGNTKYDSRLKKAESAAKKSKVGLWGACDSPHAEITPVPKLGSADNPAPVGTAVESDGRSVTLNSYYFTSSAGTFVAEQNKDLLIVNLTITNISAKDQLSYSDQCVDAKDVPGGFDFNVPLIFNVSDFPLGAGDQIPGDTVTGNVAILVASSSSTIRVRYTAGSGSCNGDDFYWIVTR